MNSRIICLCEIGPFDKTLILERAGAGVGWSGWEKGGRRKENKEESKQADKHYLGEPMKEKGLELVGDKGNCFEAGEGGKASCALGRGDTRARRPKQMRRVVNHGQSKYHLFCGLGAAESYQKMKSPVNSL